MKMKSNIKLVSNVCLREGQLAKDKRYIKSIKGEGSLWQLLNLMDVPLDKAKESGLTEKQIMELKSSSRCLINDPYNGSYGLTFNKESESVEFRCLNKECNEYKECLQIEEFSQEKDDQLEDIPEEKDKVEELSKEVDVILEEITGLYSRLEIIRRELREKHN